MPPKGRGRRKLPNNGIDTSTEEVFDIISLGDASDSSSVVMTGQRPVMRGKRNQAAGRSKAPVVPEVYQDMLAEALASPSRVEVQERPRKRRQVKRLEQAPSLDGSIKSAQDNVPVHGGDDDDDDMNMHFEDVLPSIHEQTVYNDSDEGDSDDGGGRWEEVDMPSNVPRSHEMESDHEHLDLTLAAVTTPQRVAKRKGRTYSKAERGVHLEIHKLHLLCLLRHVDRRNDWCNDKEVELALKPLLSAKILRMLRPPPEWDQFRRAESINKGVAQAGELWESKFSITARGMRRSFWAANERDLQNVRSSALICFRRDKFLRLYSSNFLPIVNHHLKKPTFERQQRS